MKKTTVIIILGAISLLPSALAIILIANISEFPSRWLGLAHWGLTALIVLFAVWMIYNSYLKLVEMLGKQQLEKDKLDEEKHLSDNHHAYRMEVLKSEIRKQELDLEQLKLKKKKKE